MRIYPRESPDKGVMWVHQNFHIRQCDWSVLRMCLDNIRGDPKKLEFIYKNYVFILTCLNFSHLQSTLHLMQYSYQDVVSTAQNSFWTLQFWCLLVLLPFFCFTSSTSSKCFPLRTFFIWGNGKKRWLGQDWVNREGGSRELYHFWSKTTEHSAWCGQVHL